MSFSKETIIYHILSFENLSSSVKIKSINTIKIIITSIILTYL